MNDPVAGWQWASGEGRRQEPREAVRVWEPGENDDPARIPAVAVLATGIGSDGYGAAEAAADAAYECLGATPWTRIRERMARAGNLANRAVLDGKKTGNIGDNGATGLLLAAMTDDALTWWGAGNAVLLRLRTEAGLQLANSPVGTSLSKQTPGLALMGMPYEDPDTHGDGLDVPEAPMELAPGDLVLVASAGISMLTEARTEDILREALRTGGNPAEEILRETMLAEGGSPYNLSVASRQAATDQPARRRKRRKRLIEARLEGGTSIVTISGRRLDPDRSRKLRNHSRDFSWGYRGTGPLQLALALLLEVQGKEEEALRCYEAFHEERIARLSGRAWTMEAAKVSDWIREHAEARRAGGGEGPKRAQRRGPGSGTTARRPRRESR